MWMKPDHIFSPDESQVWIIRVDSDWEFSLNHCNLEFMRISRLRMNWIKFWFGLKISDWFLIDLYQTRLKNFFGLARMRSDTDFGMNWNESDWFEMNFNPKLLPGAATAFALGEVRPQLRFPVASRMPTHNSTTCSLSLSLSSSLSLSIYLSISLCLLYAYYMPGRITRLLTHTVDIQSHTQLQLSTKYRCTPSK